MIVLGCLELELGWNSLDWEHLAYIKSSMVMLRMSPIDLGNMLDI